MHILVILDERNALSVLGEYLFYGRRRLESGLLVSEIKRLGGVEKLNGEDCLAVLHDPDEFGGGVGTHADMILLSLRGWDGVD